MTLFSKRIPLATDGSEEAELAAGVARSTGSELHVVHVELLPLMPPYPEVLGWRDDLEWAERRTRELLDEQVKKVEDACGTVAGVNLREEFPAEETVALAEELGMGLIVVGSRGRGGIRRALTGSVSDRDVHHCPVLVVRSPNSADGRERSPGPLPARFAASKKKSFPRRQDAASTERSPKNEP